MGASTMSQVRLFNMHPTGAVNKEDRLEEIMQEGGIAGTIDKRLANALEKKDGRYSVMAGARYEELNDSWDPEIAISGSKHIIPDELAFVFKRAVAEVGYSLQIVMTNSCEVTAQE